MSRLSRVFFLGASMRWRSGALAISTLAVVGTGGAMAQTLYGTLTGTVTDAAGAKVPNATVRLKNVDTGYARQATSDSTGNYQVTDLQPGNYDIVIAAPSFGENTTRRVPIGANQTQRIDAVLSVAGVSQSVEVSTAPPALQTDRADVNYEISPTQVAQLPTTSSAGRNFQGLYKLIPGIPPPQEMNSQAGNPGRTQAVNANGVANTINSTKIDGAAVGYPWLQSIVAYIPPTDSIESANIVTNSFNAEQGSAGGVAANLIVKSGTNSFHGGAWEYNSISQFNARNYFTRVSTTPVVPKNIYNEFGANIGGPIVKNKLFFFFNYNRTTLRQLKSGSMTVPLAAIRGGDFSSVVNGFGSLTAAQTLIYDPATGNADGSGRVSFLAETGKNAIPASRLSPAAVKLLSLLPTETNSSSIAGNYVGAQVVAFNRGTYDAKVNYNPTDKTTFFGRYSVQRSLIVDPPAFGSAVGTTWDGGQPGTAPGTIQNIGLGATHAFTPNFLIDANAGFVRINLAAQGPDYGTNEGTGLLGIPGTNGTTTFQSGLPGFNMTNGLSSFGNYTASNPFQFRDMQYVGNVNGTYIHGNHSYRFGGEYTHSAINQLQTNNNTPRGESTFSGGVTGSNNTAANPVTGGLPNYFRTVADYLLGLPQSLGKTVQLFQPNGPRFSAFGFYAQDTWKASSKLTLNYGVRYEYYPFATRDHTGVFRFDPALNEVLIGGQGTTPTNTGENVGHGNLVPRLGVNYRVDDKTVIRSGFGMTVDPENYRFFRDSYPALTTLNNTGLYSNANDNYIPAGSLNTVNQTGPYGTLTVGIPTVVTPNISSGVVFLPYNYTTQTAPQTWRRGYVESYNLFVDRDLVKDVVATVGYVGTHQVRQVAGLDINAGGVGGVRPLFSQPAAGINGVATRYVNQILDVQPLGTVEYSGLQAQLTDRQLKTFQFGYAYTYSHALNYFDTNSTLGALTFNTPGLYKRNYGNSGFDRTHVNALWTVYQIPVGPGRQFLSSGLVGRLVGGFDLNTVTSYVSGTPFQITDGGLAGNGDTAVPNMISKPALNGVTYNGITTNLGNPAYFINQGNFASTGGGAAGNGNVGRNTIRGPGWFNIDAALTRNIPIYREFALVLKAEAFSLTNTPQFSNPTSNLTDGNFGRVTATSGGSRTLRLSGRISF